jgi:endogenous inhibitor of DNA gyrase (YacG/DUF329 family)
VNYNPGVLRCPSCRKPVKAREENEAFPFCSPRCRALDLSRWFTGSYRVPGPPADVEPPRSEDAPHDRDDEQ